MPHQGEHIPEQGRIQVDGVMEILLGDQRGSEVDVGAGRGPYCESPMQTTR